MGYIIPKKIRRSVFPGCETWFLQNFQLFSFSTLHSLWLFFFCIAEKTPDLGGQRSTTSVEIDCFSWPQRIWETLGPDLSGRDVERMGLQWKCLKFDGLGRVYVSSWQRNGAVLLFDEVKLVTSGYLADCQSSLNLSPRKCDNQLKWRPQMDTSSNHFMLLMPLHQWSIGKITWGGLWRWATDWWCSRTGWGVFSQYLQVRRTNDPD